MLNFPFRRFFYLRKDKTVPEDYVDQIFARLNLNVQKVQSEDEMMHS